MSGKSIICEIVLDDPGRKNALSYTLLNDLSNSLTEAKQDDARAVIITGAGDVFSAGANFEDLTGTIDDIAIDDAIEQIVLQIRDMPAPVFAAIEGPCMGGAVDIALACDFVVASEDAFFEIPAARLGLLYNPEAVKRWHARVGGQTLRRILLLGERFTSAEAQQAGVVSHLVDKGSAVRCFANPAIASGTSRIRPRPRRSANTKSPTSSSVRPPTIATSTLIRLVISAAMTRTIVPTVNHASAFMAGVR